MWIWYVDVLLGSRVIVVVGSLKKRDQALLAGFMHEVGRVW